MSGTLSVDFPALNRLFEGMNDVAKGGVTIDAYFREHVCDTAGFDYPACALEPIAHALPGIASAFSSGMSAYQTKWSQIEHAMFTVAKGLEQQDRNIRQDLSHYTGTGAVCEANEPPAQYTAIFGFNAIEPELPAPGRDQVKGHPKEFEVAAKTWDTARDTINDIVDKINSIGVITLPKLPSQSLAEYIVYPLAGDYHKIGSDADACTKLDAAMHEWGQNFLHLNRTTPAAISGASGLALCAEFATYDKIMTAVGDVIGRGKVVFLAIAKVSEEIAVAVEKALVILGNKLAELVAKIGERATPFLGEAIMAYRFLTKNIHMFDDIIHDIEEVQKIIQSCFDLVDKIKAWAARAAEDLQTFKQVLTALDELPGAHGGTHIATDPHGATGLIKNLSDIDFNTNHTGNHAGLDGQLGGLQGQAQNDSTSQDSLPSGTIISGPDYPPGQVPTTPPAPPGEAYA